MLRIATGGVGGAYLRLGGGLARAVRAEYPDLHFQVLVTAASSVNIGLLLAGAAEIGFTQADVLVGQATPGLAALTRLHDDYLHLVVRRDGSLRSVKDLRARRVSLGAVGSGTEVTARRLLAVAGIHVESDVTNVALPLDRAAAALARREIDAFFFSGGLPVTGIAALAGELAIRVVTLGEYATMLSRSYGEVYVERSIPASTYRAGSVSTVATPNFLVVRTVMAEETAYALTRCLLERRDVLAVEHPAAERLNRRSAVLTEPLPLHPGAIRYFRTSKP